MTVVLSATGYTYVMRRAGSGADYGMYGVDREGEAIEGSQVLGSSPQWRIVKFVTRVSTSGYS